MWHGAIGPGDLARMPVGEVFDRYTAGKRVEAERRRFAIESGAFAWMDKQGKAAVQMRIDSLARTEVSRRSAFEVLPDQHRVVQIGGFLKRHGDRWADRHPEMMRWLKGREITREAAITAHDEWFRREVIESPAVIKSYHELDEYREQLRRSVP